jgi:hypothetical protein
MSTDTPRKVRSTSEASFSKSGLVEKRATLLQDLGKIPQVSTADDMINALLPRVSTDTATMAHAILIQQGYITGDRWSAYPADPISPEDTGFAPLSKLFDAIISALPRFRDSCLLTLKVDGKRTPHSSLLHDNSKPDGYGLLKQSTMPDTERPLDKDSWEDMPLVLEFKLKNTEENFQDVRLSITLLQYEKPTDLTSSPGCRTSLVVDAPCHAERSSTAVYLWAYN